MNRTEKAELIETLQSTFGAATSVVVTHQTGMTVAESSELRQKMREAGANYRVTKNRVTKIALRGTKFEDLTEFFKGPTAVCTSSDAVAAAKTVFEFTSKGFQTSLPPLRCGRSVSVWLSLFGLLTCTTSAPPSPHLRTSFTDGP